MKTSELLELDLRCDDTEQRRKNLLILKKALMQIDGVRYSNMPLVDLGSLENVLHNLCSGAGEKSIRIGSIQSIYSENEFSHYTIGFIMTGYKEGHRTIIAHTLYELYAKSVIYVYSVTKKRR